MAFTSQDSASIPGPSSTSVRSRSDIDSPHSPDPAAAIRLRFLVPNPHDSVALSKTLVDIIKDVQATRRSQDGNAYILSADQFDDLLLLAQQNNRNASASGLASIENQLTELTNKITDVQHAVRGTRPWLVFSLTRCGVAHVSFGSAHRSPLFTAASFFSARVQESSRSLTAKWLHTARPALRQHAPVNLLRRRFRA